MSWALILLKVRSWFGSALNWVLASTTHILIVALVTVSVWGYLGWHGKAKAEQVLHSTEVTYAASQKKAKAAQDALNAKVAASNNNIAKESSNAHSQALASANDAVARYAASHRVPACPRSAASGAITPTVPSDTSLAVSASGTPDLVVVTNKELSDFATNTVRAESCRALGQAWVDAGAAVVGER